MHRRSCKLGETEIMRIYIGRERSTLCLTLSLFLCDDMSGMGRVARLNGDLPVRMEIVPHIIMAAGRYSEGFPM